MKEERLEPLSEFKEDEAIEKIIGYMARIYLARGDPILKIPGWKIECRKKIKEALPRFENSRNNLLQVMAEKLTGEMSAPEPVGRFAWGYQDKYGRYQVRKTDKGKELIIVDSHKTGGWR